MNEYEQQRLVGSRKIIEKAKILAQRENLIIDKILWNNGEPIDDRRNHILAITANCKTYTGIFCDEWLADYPGGVGLEKANYVLSALIRKFK